MKNTYIETIPEHTKEKSKYCCDICGVDLQNDRSWGIHAKMSYDGDHESGTIDMCMKCMRDTVMPMVCSVYKIKPR